MNEIAAPRSVDHPRVTVGLPVYNGERYLAQALDSLLAQTYTDFELIISDNGSTDRTRAICESYAARDPRVRYYRYEENRGAAWNFNNVFHLARTVYFKWQCYDDLMAPRFLEDCVAVLDREPEIVLAYPRTRVIDDEGGEIGLWADELEVGAPPPHLRLRHYWNHKCRNEAQYGLMRTQVLGQTGLMGTIPYSDQVLMAEIMLRGPVREIPEYHFHKRFHAQISTEANKDVYALAAFLAPSNKGKTGLPRLKRWMEFVRAVNRTPMPPHHRLLCHAELITLSLQPANWIRMAQDLAVLIARRFKRLSAPPSGALSPPARTGAARKAWTK